MAPLRSNGKKASAKADSEPSERTCVLYDAAGRIRHVHTVVSFGTPLRSDRDIEREARARHKALAGLDGRPLSGALEALHVDKPLRSLAGYRVDVRARRLVEDGAARRSRG